MVNRSPNLKPRHLRPNTTINSKFDHRHSITKSVPISCTKTKSPSFRARKSIQFRPPKEKPSVNLDPQDKRQVIFGPHTKKKQISKIHTQSKRLSIPTLEPSQFRPRPKMEFMFGPHTRTKSILIFRTEIKNQFRPPNQNSSRSWVWYLRFQPFLRCVLLICYNWLKNCGINSRSKAMPERTNTGYNGTPCSPNTLRANPLSMCTFRPVPRRKTDNWSNFFPLRHVHYLKSPPPPPSLER